MTSRHSPSRGIVYLVGSTWQGKQVIKIGRTGPEGEDLRLRITQLSIGIPGTLPCIHASLVNDASTVENNLHTIFQQLRVTEGSSREFFDLNPESARLALLAYQKKDMTRYAPRAAPNRDNKPTAPQNQDTGKLPTATFALLKIRVGEKLKLARDQRVTCEVADGGTTVRYKGKDWALSTLTTELIDMGHPLQGIRYWTYEGQTLIERRDEILERQRR